MRRYAFLLASALGLATGSLAMAGPFLPGLQGLDRVQPGLWIDQTATAAQRTHIKALIARARRDATKALGSNHAQPEWQVCTTAACDAAIGLHPRGLTWHDKVIQIGSRAADDPRFYLHEAVHAELHNAAGLIGSLNNALPVWLDEGIAVLISHTPGFPTEPTDCATATKTPPPLTRKAFSQLAGAKGETASHAYLVAACATRSWLARGNDLTRLTNRLRKGEVIR